VLQLLTGVNPGIQLKRKFYGQGLFRRCSMVAGAGNLTLFEGVPELVLAPVELEFDLAVKKPDQHYLGLCVDENRKDEEIDPAFEQAYDEILDRGKKGKVIYCAFGTYCASPDEMCAITEFAYKLGALTAGKADVTLILALPPGVQNVLKQLGNLPGNAFVFSRVPQQKVLAVADLFITHGGLSSVREAVFWGVPMLVYPLDLDWDQKGNGLKVEFHQIGLRGELRGARPEEIAARMHELLANPAYRNNVRKLRGALQEKYSDDYVNVLINDLISGG
jgi:UDP:flavonoid glycosyltransferase YjiC (YdhE family)